ncbi:MAG TPA: DUF92 domain-containing protein [Gemmatimonadales bacterium]|nr:DUF92 domain-containing protein [Gemmatimonadales bacterium]
MTWLTPGGVAAALLVGAAVWWGLGWLGLVPLFAFLLSGSLLTRLATGSSAARRPRQVLANGGVTAALALIGSWPAAMGALAAAAADTWATEIGAFSPTDPHDIATGQPVPRGRSGGITPLGTMGGVLGAIAIAGLAALVAPRSRFGLAGAMLAAAAGIFGMLSDSLLGSTLQGRYTCPVCTAVSEQPGSCHAPLELTRGLPWLDNDAVNLAGASVGAIVAALGWQLLPH